MNREEVLERSRHENKNQDVYEKEVVKEGANAGAITAALLATVLFATQIFLERGANFALYAVALSIPAATFIVKAIRLRRRHEIVVAILYAAGTLAFSAAHICRLVAGAAIL